MSSVIKSVLVLVFVLLVVLFAVSNVHFISMNFLTGRVFQVRVIYLVLFSYFLGVATSAYFLMIVRFKKRRALKRSLRAKQEQEEDMVDEDV